MSDTDDAATRPHVGYRDSVERDRRALGAFIEDGTASSAEIGYYESFSDPLVRALDARRRREHGHYLRRLRRRRGAGS